MEDLKVCNHQLVKHNNHIQDFTMITFF